MGLGRHPLLQQMFHIAIDMPAGLGNHFGVERLGNLLRNLGIGEKDRQDGAEFLFGVDNLTEFQSRQVSQQRFELLWLNRISWGHNHTR